MKRRVLLTVSGIIPEDVEAQVAKGLRPRPDYLELGEAMRADLLDVAEARRRTGLLGRVVERVAGHGALVAWASFRARRSYDTIFSDGEQVGLLLALLSKFVPRRRWAHVMIAHVITVRKKALFYRVLRLGRHIDAMVVYSSLQKRLVSEELCFPADRVVWTPFMVDTAFFAPDRVPSTHDRMICSAGLERRDYRSLVEAVRGLDVRVVIAAASPWSTQADNVGAAELPANVERCSLGFFDLRQLYADALFVVVPLEDVEFQAGVTTILEAMAMGKAVVCSSTRGQTDVVVDGETGVYVSPGSPQELRATITRLLDDPVLAEQMGARARDFAEQEYDVEVYARRLADVVARTEPLS